MSNSLQHHGACQASLYMGFCRQEYWSGLPCPSPRDLPRPRIKPAFPALAGRFLTSEPPGTLQLSYLAYRKCFYKDNSGSMNQNFLFLKKIFIYLFMYLAVLGVCGTCNLGSSLQPAGSFSCSMWDLVPWPGIEPRFPALIAQNLSHWTTREVPEFPFFIRLNNVLFYTPHFVYPPIHGHLGVFLPFGCCE